jgi:hypothetical protein
MKNVTVVRLSKTYYSAKPRWKVLIAEILLTISDNSERVITYLVNRLLHE